MQHIPEYILLINTLRLIGLNCPGEKLFLLVQTFTSSMSPHSELTAHESQGKETQVEETQVKERAQKGVETYELGHK